MGQKRRDAIPVLPLHGVFYAVCFGLAGFFDPLDKFGRIWIGEDELQWGLVAAFVGLVSLYVSYYRIAPRILPRRPRWKWPFDFKENYYGNAAIFIFLFSFSIDLFVKVANLTYLYQFTFATWYFFFMFLLHAYWSGKLKRIPGKIFAYLIMPGIVIFFSGLLNSQIAGFVSMVTWIGIVQIATRQKLPYKYAILAIAVFFLLQPVKGQFRNLVWDSSTDMSVLEKYQAFFGTALDYYFGEGTDSESRSEGAAVAFNRVNHLHVTAAIIADTPSKCPFLYGQSYLPLIVKWIPRSLWPDKPREDLGNRWAREYGFLSSRDYTTSFNLPWLPEMYMNFGMFGIVLISFIIGILFRFLRDTFWQNPANSSSFAFGLVLAGPLMFVESNLSMKVGGLFIASVAIFAAVSLLAYTCPRLVTRTRPQALSR
jgi:hypothetical protein